METLGLTSTHAEQLLKQYGLNSIKSQPKRTILGIFFEQFNNFLTFLLIAAATVSIITGEIIDGVLILVIIFLNALFGLYQEIRAEKSLNALKEITITKTRVIRDGEQIEIDSKFLVPGDIVFIEEGVKIPADGTVIEGINLQTNEAALTGESLPIDKSKDDKVFMGTITARGRGFFQVTQTAMQTQFGKIADTITDVQEYKTPLQKKLENLSKTIGYIGITASIIVLVLSILQTGSYFSSFLLAVALAVAVVPEGLPAVLTITLSLGVAKMAKKKAIVRKLASIEALGSITVLATDKTGTLTANQMKVKEVYINDIKSNVKNIKRTDYATKLLLLNSVLCSTASISHKNGERVMLGDPTEGALLILAEDKGININEVRTEWQLIKEYSFDSRKKEMSVIVKNQDKHLTLTKGAPEVILKKSKKIIINNEILLLNKARKEKIEKTITRWADEGLRVLAFSYSDNNKKEGDVFIGMIALYDPPRQNIDKVVEKAKNAGIKVLIVTGDNKKTAITIGKITKIHQSNDVVLEGSDIDNMSDDELKQILPKVSIIARSNPFHKHRVVKLFQEMGEIVAVTGDGINDSIALKQADVGIAMGKTGTDVAKESADMIILDDNFETIVNAIEEGRNITKNLKSAIKYLLSCNISEALSLISALGMGIAHLFYPIQLLYINLVTDGIPALALSFSPKQRNLMRHRPQKKQILLSKKDLIHIIIIGLLATVLVLVSLLIYSKDALLGKTAAFTVLTLIQSFIFLDMWLNNKLSFKNTRLLNKPIFILSFFTPFILQYVIVIFPTTASVFKIKPITPQTFFTIVLLSFVIIPLLKIFTSNKLLNTLVSSKSSKV